MERLQVKKRRHTRRTQTEDTGAQSRKWILLLFTSFGLFCVTQAVNLYLRIGFDLRCNNAVAERYKSEKYFGSIKDNVTAERDGCEKNLVDIRMETALLTQNLSEMIRSYSWIEKKNQQILEERDSLNEERDNLKIERNILKQKLQDITITTTELYAEASSFELASTTSTTSLTQLYPTAHVSHATPGLGLPSSENYTSKGWVYFSGSLYLGSTTEQSWKKSRELCQERGADLIIITSTEEQEFARSKFRGRRWIGLSDQEEEGVWKWVDGSLVNTSFWQPGEPNDAWGIEDCGELNRYWNDAGCVDNHYYICEKTIH